MGVAEVLVPGKFIFLISHLLVCVVILSAHEQNIYTTLGSNIRTTSDEFTSARSGVLAATALSIVTIGLEIIMLFIGLTLFYDRLNIFQCVFHALGAFLYGWYNLDTWNWYTLWYLFAIFSVIPFVMELFSTGVAFLYYRKLSNPA